MSQFMKNTMWFIVRLEFGCSIEELGELWNVGVKSLTEEGYRHLVE
jgi:hypothetical protein